MNEQNNTPKYLFPVVDGMVQGSVTRISNSFIGLIPNGAAFTINEDEILETFAEAGRDIGREVLKKLEGVSNVQESVDFTFSLNEPFNDLIPAGTDARTRTMILDVLSRFNPGVQVAKPARFAQNANAGPRVQESQGNPLHNMNDEADKSVDGEGLNKLHNAIHSGKSVVIELKDDKNNANRNNNR